MHRHFWILELDNYGTSGLLIHEVGHIFGLRHSFEGYQAWSSTNCIVPGKAIMIGGHEDKVESMLRRWIEKSAATKVN